jgi:hypothetical protein
MAFRDLSIDIMILFTTDMSESLICFSDVTEILLTVIYNETLYCMKIFTDIIILFPLIHQRCHIAIHPATFLTYYPFDLR